MAQVMLFDETGSDETLAGGAPEVSPKRRGRPKKKKSSHVKDLLDAAVGDPSLVTLEQFLVKVESVGVEVSCNVREGVLQGMRFELNSENVTGSEVGHSWRKIQKRFTFDQQTEWHLIAERQGKAFKARKPKSTKKMGVPQTLLDSTQGVDHSAEAVADGRVKDFEFSTHPSQAFLKKAFKDYTSRTAVGKIYQDYAPTGTGKSWALAEETSAQMPNLTAKQTVFMIAPEKRHLRSICNDLAKKISSDVVVWLPGNPDAVIEIGIPQECPFRDGECRYENAAALVSKIDSAVRDIKISQNNFENQKKYAEKIESRMRDIDDNGGGGYRSELREYCRKNLRDEAKSGSPNVNACRRCIPMFPGNRIFDERNSPLVVATTFDKLVRGLAAFEMDRSGKVRFFRYSPNVSRCSDGLDPFENSFFILEEHTLGHQRLVSVIEKNAVNISIVKAAEAAVRSAKDEFSKVQRKISDQAPIVYSKNENHLVELKDLLASRHEEYYLADKFHPYKNGNARLILYPKSVGEFKGFVNSMSPAYSSLFSSGKIGFSMDPIVSDDSYRAVIERFDSSKEMKDAGHYSLPIAVNMMVRKILHPIAWCSEALSRIDGSLPIDRRRNWASVFLNGIYDGEGNSKVRSYVLSMTKNDSFRTQDAKKKGSVLDEFYLRGYEFMEAYYSDRVDEVVVESRLSQSSPEAMLDSLLDAGNTIYISSASSTIRSGITNTDFDWLEKRGHRFERLAEEEGQRVLQEKTSEKTAPEIIWGTKTSTELYFNFERKQDSIAMADVLNHFAWSLHGDGSPAKRSRYAVLFFNSKKDAINAMGVFERYAERSLASVAHTVCTYVQAETFRSGEVEVFRKEISQHLSSEGPPRFFLIFSTYRSLAMGANLHVELDQVPAQSANLWKYCGDRTLRRYAGKNGLAVDMSDIVLVEPVTNLVNNDNYLRVGHHLAAKGDLSWSVIGRGIFTRSYDDDEGRFRNTAGAVKYTEHFVAGQFDTIMQAVGRQDRTLNSAAETKVFANRNLAGTMASVTPAVKGLTILPPAMKRLLEGAVEQVESVSSQDRIDTIGPSELSSGEFFSMLAADLRKSPEARHLWVLLRAFLMDNVLLSNKEYLDINSNERACWDINPMLEKYGVNLKDFYFQLPKDYVMANNFCAIRFEEDKSRKAYRFYKPDVGYRGRMVTLKRVRKVQGSAVYIPRPDVIREVILPAEQEQFCRNLITLWGKMEVMDDASVPAYLMERADLFVEQCDACVDAKSWSVNTMLESTNEESINYLIHHARRKLKYMQDEAPSGSWAPKRYIYAFREWWPLLKERSGQGAVFFDSQDRIVGEGDEWDVAFVHAQDERYLVSALHAFNCSPEGKN